MNASQPPIDLCRTVADAADRGEAFAVALVLEAEGSTPCKAGARAVLDARGAVRGTIGGGGVEAEAQRRAVEVLAGGCPVVFEFALEGGALRDHQPICGGRMRVLVDPTAARHRDAYAAAAEARHRRERGVLLTAVRGTAPPAVAVRFLAEGDIGAQAGFPGAEAVRAALEREEPALLVAAPAAATGERLEVLVEPLVARPVLVIAGGGHIGQALAAQAALVGFDVAVIDDRPEFASPERFPEGTVLRCGRAGEELAALPLGAETYVVIVTRGHQHDAEALAACLGRPAAYVGMIGSRRKVALMREAFLASGRATAAEFDRAYAPIGLDIGAVTVPEIATSITAQLVAVRRRGSAARMPAGQDAP